MADFSLNATELSAPQGAGTSPVAPVQERATDTSAMPLLNQLGSIFVNGLDQYQKQAQQQRTTAVVSEYLNNEKVYTDALTSGQWNSSQATAASRINYTRMITAYPQYTGEISKARTDVYAGTEISEAQKTIDNERQQRQTDIASASAKGFTFYPGMSVEAQNKTIDAAKQEERTNQQFSQYTARAAEARSAAGEGRAESAYAIAMRDDKQKHEAVTGLQNMAGANFDALTSSGTDLIGQVGSGKIPYETAFGIHTQNVQRIKAGLLAVAGQNPQLAAPWSGLFDEMDKNIQAQLDPGKKSAREAQELKDQYDVLVRKQQLLAVTTNPAFARIAASAVILPQNPITGIVGSDLLKTFITKGVDINNTIPEQPAPQIIGSGQEDKAFKFIDKTVTDLNNGKIANSDQATKELNNTINLVLKNTTTVDGSLGATALKKASAFYASSNFGKMVIAGGLDPATLNNATYVMQIQYVPDVQRAVINVLDTPLPTKDTSGAQQKIGDQVDIQMKGGRVTFVPKPAAYTAPDTPVNFGRQNMADIRQADRVKQLQLAEDGLNNILRMNAHMDGTTDYTKYWEDNKSKLLPGVFGEGLKVGTIKNGYQYNGGDARDPRNYTKVGGNAGQ